jgi:hypothetical protein
VGLRVNVYRSTYGASGPPPDCTNGGISGRHDTLCVVNIDGSSEPEGGDAVALIDGPTGTKILVPVLADGDEWQEFAPQSYIGPLAGGNLAHAPDARWFEAVGFYGAVHIHDRYETVAEYVTMSR